MYTKNALIKTIFVVISILSLAACASQAVSTVASAPAAAAALPVTSTLDGLTSLPHRIQWEAKPSLETNISEVDFLIDGQLAWVEKNAPYFYGTDNNYLVTSFLKPGEHSFTVRRGHNSGQTANSTVKASVAAAPTPPDGLANTSWGRELTAADLQKTPSTPTGHWDLTINSAGWMVHDPQGSGLLFDVDNQSGGKVEFRPTIEVPPYPNTFGGAFCSEPDPAALWTYAVGNGGKTLTLHPAGQDPCVDRQAILGGHMDP